jgi:hypothetical protein
MSEPQTRRPYEKPRLKRYGALAEITRARGRTGKKDGGKGKTANKTGL